MVESCFLVFVIRNSIVINVFFYEFFWVIDYFYGKCYEVVSIRSFFFYWKMVLVSDREKVGGVRVDRGLVRMFR